MRKVGLTGLIILFMLLPWEMAWAGLTARGLLALLPPEQARADVLSRGDFAVMLAAAAQIKGDSASFDLPADVPADSWFTGALRALWQQGIICGYPNGTLRPEQGITCLEAVILTARAMGLPNEISGPGSDFIMGEIPYGLNQYAFFQRQGLLPPVKAMAFLQPAVAAEWLAEVFSSDPQAENLLDKCRQILARKQAIGIRGDTSIKFYSRPGLPTTAELDQLTIKGKILNELLLPGQMHQVLNLELEGRQTMQIEQIVDNGNLYRQVTDVMGQTDDWQKLAIAPDVSQLIRQQQNLGLPASIYPWMQCRYLGESKVDGQDVLGISFYARVNKAGAVADILPQAALVNGMESYLDLPGQPVRSISYWGILYLDPDSFLPVKSDFNLVITFTNVYQDQPVPMAAIEMRYRVDSYSYDGIEITLPYLEPYW